MESEGSVLRVIKDLSGKFEHKGGQDFQIQVPIDQGVAYATVSRGPKQDFKTSVDTAFFFNKGIISAVANSDKPCSIQFSSKQISPHFGASASFYTDDRNPAAVKTYFRYSVYGVTMSERTALSIRSTSESPSISPKFAFDIGSKSAIGFKKFFFKTYAELESRSLLFEARYRGIPEIAASMSYNFAEHQLKDIRFYAKTQLKSWKLAAFAQRADRSAYITARRRISERTAIGMSAGLNRIFSGTNFVAKVYGSEIIDEAAKAKVMVSSDASLSLSLTLAYQDFLGLRFTALSKYAAGGRESSYGASICFDLCSSQKQ